MSNWSSFLNHELSQAYMQQTLEYVTNKRAEGIAVYPPEPQVFSAFDATPLSDIKVGIQQCLHLKIFIKS